MANLKDKIYQAFMKSSRLTATALMKRFGVSRQAIHRHLKALVREGKILKQGSSRRTTFYLLNTAEARRTLLGKPRRFQKRIRAKGASEDVLLNELKQQAGFLDPLSPEALGIFQYAFTEMVNNAIDHSESTFITVDVTVDAATASFVVKDTGIGVFRSIEEKLGLASELEAIEDLLKGKQTTMPERHSGEGIFFTSKAADRFELQSHRKKLVVDNGARDLFVKDVRFTKGTRVFFEMPTTSKRKLDDIFQEYTKESFTFDKTSVAVKLFESGESYVSRSQARRLLHALEQFREIVLDFKGVETVGQAFADEVFRVFQNRHPDIVIRYEHANENVTFMIRRAPRQEWRRSEDRFPES